MNECMCKLHMQLIIYTGTGSMCVVVNTNSNGSSPDDNVLVVDHGNEGEVSDDFPHHQVGEGVWHQHEDLPHVAEETNLKTCLDILTWAVRLF